MGKRIFLLNVSFLLVICAVLPVPAFAASAFTLSNGMKVFLEENHRAPVVTQMIFYQAGSRNEPEGKSGVSHLLEHMMFKGTKNFPNGYFSAEIAKLGGSENAYTGKDLTAYHQSISKEHLPLIMKLEADRMQNLQFSPQNFATEKQVVLEERLLRYENSPASILAEQMNLALFGHNPYGRPTIGFKDEIASLSAEDIKGFYQTYYRPNNAFLVYSGDITEKELLPLAEKYYGVLKNPPETNLAPRNNTEPPQSFTQEITFRHPLVKQPILMLSILNQNPDLIYPAEVLSEIIGEESIGKLYLSLVLDKEIALSASASFNRQKYLPGTLNITIIPQRISDITQIKKELLQIKNLKINEKDLEKAKKRIISSLIYLKDDILSQANDLGTAIALGDSFDEYRLRTERISAVTLPEVQKALNGLFSDAAPKVQGILLPSEPKANP